MVLHARDATQATAREALETLCEAYWYPLYTFLRRRGHDADEAADLIQGYFARFLEKGYIHDVRPKAGRFRSFLLASLKHHTFNEAAKDRALKRGAGVAAISLDAQAAEDRYRLEPADGLTPEMVFERHWALTVVERAIARLGARAASRGHTERFEVLKPLLLGAEPRRPYADVADQLGMSVTAVKAAIHRLRQSYGEALRREIEDTVTSPSEANDELRHLLTVLRESAGGAP